MYIKQLIDITNLHTHLKGHQKAFTPSGVMPLGSSVFLLEKLTTKSRVIVFLIAALIFSAGYYSAPIFFFTIQRI